MWHAGAVAEMMVFEGRNPVLPQHRRTSLGVVCHETHVRVSRLSRDDFLVPVAAANCCCCCHALLPASPAPTTMMTFATRFQTDVLIAGMFVPRSFLVSRPATTFALPRMSSSSGSRAMQPPTSTHQLHMQIKAYVQHCESLAITDAARQATQSRASIDASAADRLAARRVLSAHTKARALRT